jgi:cyclic di-GMP phosphodiesterase Gmr
LTGRPTLADLGPEVVGATAAAVVLTDGEGVLLDANPAACALLGLPPEQVRGAEAAAVLAAPREAAELLRVLRAVARTGASHAHEHDLPPTEDGQRRTRAWTTARLREAPTVLACVGVDVSEARSATEDLLVRARTDELTGLPNRAHLLEVLTSLADSGASVLFCDLNGFKAVNDSFGHAAGDAVLVEVARRLRLAVRGEDLVARLGGDEFVIVAPPDPRASPEGLTRRVLSAMRQPMILAGGVVAVVGVSVGTALLTPGEDPVRVLEEADARMYASKSLRASRAGGLGAPVSS